MAKKIVVLLIALAVVAGAAGAMEFAPGTFLFNIGSGVSFSAPEFDTLAGDSVFVPGGSFSFEWLPSAKAGTTYGVETGFYYAGYDAFSSIGVPILFRLGWHPAFIKVPNLDVYLLGKVGVTLGFWDMDTASYPFGISYGGNIGAKYFFTPMIGMFLEGGYNCYRISDSTPVYANIKNYVTLGVTIKRDGKK